MTRRGFTLIELLVVISIISLLASVVLASLNSARDKGRLGAGRQFEAGVYHAEADQAVGIWDFTECAGSSIVDRSGNGNNMSLSGSPIWSTTDVPYGSNCSLAFNASYYGVLSSASIADFANSQPFTISLWVKKNSVNVRETLISSANYILGGYAFAIDSNDIVFFTENAPSSNTSVTATGAFSTGLWMQLTAVFDGTNGYIYKDGKQVAKGALASPGPNTTPLKIGWATQGGWSNLTNSNMTNVKIYGKALTAQEVGKLYAEQKGRFENLARN